MFQRLLNLPLVASLAEAEEKSLSTTGVIFWWEKRRWLYNALVGAAGVISIFVVVVFASVLGTECGVPDPPIAFLFAAVAYGIIANICYSFGCLAELIARSTSLDANSREFGAAIFALGTVSSIGLTLAPAVLLPSLCTLGRVVNGHW